MLYRLTRTYLTPYAVPLAVLLVLQLVATLASLYLPSLNGRIIDEGVAVGDTAFILRAGVVMLAVSLVQVATTIAATRIGAQTSASLGRDVRASIFSTVGRFSAQELSRFGAPTLISRSTNDVTQVQQVTYMFFAMMVSAPLMMVGGIFMALREDVGLSWLVAVAVPALAVAVALVIVRMVPHFRAMQKSVDSVNRILREQITGVRVVRAFVREDVERERFAEANRTYTGTALAVGKLMALAFPVVMVIFNASTVAVLWFGAQRVEDGQMQIGSLTAFMAYLIQILMSVMMATFMSMMIPRASVSAGRIQEVLDTESSVHAPADPVAIPPGPVAVELRGVTFAYPARSHRSCARSPFAPSRAPRPPSSDRPVGQDHAARCRPAPARRDVRPGARRGVDVRDADPEDLWSHIGLVPQRPYLFTGTVASNLGTATRTPSTTSSGRPCGWPRPRTSSAPCRTASSRPSPRAARRERRPTPRWPSPGPGEQARHLPLRRRLLRARRRDRRPTPGRSPARDPGCGCDRRGTAGVDDHPRRPHRRPRRGRVVGSGTHEELLGTCPTYVEIVQSQQAMEDAA